MILCKYLDSAGCLDIIKNRQLLATDPITFNDPFEINPGIIGKPDKYKTLRYLHNYLLPRLSSATKAALPDFNGELVLRDDDAVWKKVERELEPALMGEIEKGLDRASKSLRIICFCNPNKIKNDGDDILLWSHYGDKHKGVRIFFETDDIKILSTNLFPVSYSFERASIDITDPGDVTKRAEEAYRNILRTKNKSWEYEQEVRWIINLEECTQDDRSYIPLEPKSMRRIDFGCRSESEKIIPFLTDYDNSYQHVELYKALVHEHRFSLKYEKL